MKKPNLSELVFGIAERRTASQLESKKKALEKLETKLAATTLELLALEDEIAKHQIEPIPQSPVIVELRTTDFYDYDDGYVMHTRANRAPITYSISCSDLNIAYLASIALDPAPPDYAIRKHSSIKRNIILAKLGELELELKPNELSEDKQLTHRLVTEKAQEVADSFTEIGMSMSQFDLPVVKTVLLRKALLQYCRDTDGAFQVFGYTDAPRATDY